MNRNSLSIGRCRFLSAETSTAIYGAAVISTALIVVIRYGVARGQDFNWDQQNYHISVPFLLAHRTFWDSIAPAGIQNCFNPFVLQAQFFAMRHLSAISFAVLLAVVQSLAFMIAGLICAVIGRPTDGWRGLLLSILGFVLCLMAPMSLSESGTTLFDLITALPVLTAYAVLLVRGRWLGFATSGALAGALLGIATALKLTNGIFALGVVGFALAGRDTPRQRVVWALMCTVAAMLSFAAVGGSWHLELWERFANPVFPFYNSIFRSPDFSLTTLRDERFVPHSVLDVWRYPLYWLLGGSPRPGIETPSSEQAIRDARWIVAVGGGTLFLAALMIFRRWGSRRLAEPATGLFFAFALDYLLWLGAFGYHRYVLPLEILCGAIILVLAMLVVPYSLKFTLLLAMAMLSWRMLRVPDWGHLPWRPYWQAINPRPLEFGGPAIVFLTAKPSSFVAASLPPDARYVGLYRPGIYGDFVFEDFDMLSSNDTQFTRRLKQELATAPNVQLKEVDRGTVPSVAAALLASYGLRATNQCEMLRIADLTFRICDVVREF